MGIFIVRLEGDMGSFPHLHTMRENCDGNSYQAKESLYTRSLFLVFLSLLSPPCDRSVQKSENRSSTISSVNRACDNLVSEFHVYCVMKYHCRHPVMSAIF